MSFTHGVYKSEVATSIIAPVTGESGLPVVVGTSLKGPVNDPVLVYTYEEAIETFGASDDWDTYTLNEFIYSHFALYGQAPAVLISVGQTGSANAIIGGYDGASGKYTGLELVNYVYPKFRLIPGMILAPTWSQVAEVAAVMKAKAESVSGVFSCVALVDIPCVPNGAYAYSAVSQWKTSKNLMDKRMIVCWPCVKLGDKVYHLSTQLAGVMARTDHERGDVPYKSPSNELLQCEACTDMVGNEIPLTLEEANYLNSQGVVTALNWTGGWRVWGNRTGAYPASTDVKDVFIPVRRMYDYIGNMFITTFWQEADQPMTARLVRQIVNSFNMYMNSLQAREMILGGAS
ncbi:MAG: hypothetical protein IJQ58_08535 [Synergistaceae bacterium]|nr:hypothetical protein [Synergistaceae bacterium]